jgi:hypothetical protein
MRQYKTRYMNNNREFLKGTFANCLFRPISASFVGRGYSHTGDMMQKIIFDEPFAFFHDKHYKIQFIHIKCEGHNNGKNKKDMAFFSRSGGMYVFSKQLCQYGQGFSC